MAGAAIDDKLIQHITDTIVRNFHPRRIILFGSYAKGEARADSDVDILVEMESDKPPLDRYMEIESAFEHRHWPMDLLVYTPEEMEEYKDWSLFRTIAREGKLLYERSA